ncbi:class I SAM-dependent methyltransferase [Oceanirhabdus seepicola]|uniref:Methyltransferase domain-containing protein n=1 Tax=Oceanirhabdus seepicola TaxID=2828781 RepID=A0A9J6NZY0_9CLOT|nr:methyltransferase domain-containing protein [Oceanirhabdus seepicola]MCM1989986.1 methyltransferase domain-containing protein [Oceanirhabdus seepicola]
MYQQMTELKNRIKNINGGKVLDIATGQGVFLKTLLQNINSYEVAFGCDISKEDLEIAKNNLEDENVHLILGKEDALFFLDGEFDLVTISNGLHHFKNVDSIISEAIRVLKPNGLLLINEMLSNDLSEPQLTHKKFHDFSMRVGKLFGESGNSTAYTDKEVKRLFEIDRNSLKLIEQCIHEEDKTNFINEEEIERVSKVIDERVHSISTLSEYDKLKRDGEQIKARLREFGIHRSKHIFLLYKK